MKKVESITFMFKDYESIEIPAEYIGLITIGDIQKNIERITIDRIQEKLICKEFFIEIFQEFDGEYDSLYNITKFQRFMKARDLTTIEVKYDDDTSDYFALPYEGERGNLYQDTWISRLGNAYISISPKKCLDDFILVKDANNSVQVNLRKGRVPQDNDEGEEEIEVWLI